MTIIVRQFFAFTNVAPGDDVSITPMGIGILRVIHVMVVVDREKNLAIDSVTIVLDIFLGRPWKSGEFTGRVCSVESLYESPNLRSLSDGLPGEDAEA